MQSFTGVLGCTVMIQLRYSHGVDRGCVRLAVCRATLDFTDLLDAACTVSDDVERRGSAGALLQRGVLCYAACVSSECTTKIC